MKMLFSSLGAFKVICLASAIHIFMCASVHLSILGNVFCPIHIAENHLSNTIPCSKND